MKRILLLLLFTTQEIVFGQLSINQIQQSSIELNENINGVSFENGTIGRSVSSIGRTMIFSYDVPIDWIPIKKQTLIKQIIDSGKYIYLVENNLNWSYYYYRNNLIVDTIDIFWKDFDQIYLGDYLNLGGLENGITIDLKIKQPLGWETHDGGEINLVYFTSKGKIISLGVEETGEFYNRNEVDDFFDSEVEISNLIDFIKENSRGIYINSFKKEIINGYPFISCNGYHDNINKHYYVWVTIIEDYILLYYGFTTEKSENDLNEFKYILKSLKYGSSTKSNKINYGDVDDELIIFVEKFYRDLNNNSISTTIPEEFSVKFSNLDKDELTCDSHGVSYGMFDDSKVDILINKKSWDSFSTVQKYYILYHEMFHDVFNLEHSKNIEDFGEIMYPGFSKYDTLYMEDFLNSLNKLLNKLK
ncbi:MAG: hypothetical protein P8H25_07070 [Flavobacteriaceae bacterium]|nr:hypothetical protein [Flavobacteriaceae bacterium]